MAISIFDSAINGALFSNREASDLLSDANRIENMLVVEGALAKVLAEVAIIPNAAAAEIRQAAKILEPDPRKLARAMAENGIPVTGLVQSLRDAVSEEAAPFVHWGATSQDIVDTAQILICRSYVEHLRQELLKLVKILTSQMQNHRQTMMAGRTRGQPAVPISFGLKVATWLAPMLRHMERLNEFLPRLLVVQLGGAAGSLAAYGGHGRQVMAGMALELGLGTPDLPWHSQRDTVVEFASWLTMITGTIGKIGEDLALLTQKEVAEISAGTGRSSTMPQKANAIAPEILIAGAALARDALSSLMSAMGHSHERGGPQLILEWASLPQIMMITTANIKLANDTLSEMQVNVHRMRTNLDKDGSILAEAAAFTMAVHMPIDQARKKVAAAIQLQAEGDQRHMIDVLEELSDAPVDWLNLKDPGNYLGSTQDFIDTVADRADELIK